MKTNFTPKEIAEMVPAARAALSVTEDPWEQLVAYFDETRKLVEPRHPSETE